MLKALDEKPALELPPREPGLGSGAGAGVGAAVGEAAALMLLGSAEEELLGLSALAEGALVPGRRVRHHTTRIARRHKHAHTNTHKRNTQHVHRAHSRITTQHNTTHCQHTTQHNSTTPLRNHSTLRSVHAPVVVESTSIQDSPLLIACCFDAPAAPAPDTVAASELGSFSSVGRGAELPDQVCDAPLPLAGMVRAGGELATGVEEEAKSMSTTEAPPVLPSVGVEEESGVLGRPLRVGVSARVGVSERFLRSYWSG